MVPLLVAGLAGAGALGAFFARRWPRTAALDCALALVAVVGVALLVPIGPAVPVGESFIRDSEMLRALVIVASVALGGILVLVAMQAPEGEAGVVAGAVVATIALSFSVAEPSVALTLAAAAGSFGMAGLAATWRGAFAQVASVPGLCLAAVTLWAAVTLHDARTGPGAAAALDGDAAARTGPVIVGALIAIALVARLGTIPVHFFPLRLARGTSLAVVPMQAALLPAVFALLVLGWLAGGTLGAVIAGTALGPVLVTLGAATMLLAVPAMLVQDDLGALVTVHAMSDLGVVIVAVGAGVTTDMTSVATLGVWLTLSFLARTAVAACAVTLAARTGSRSIRDSQGWMRIAPLLAPAWVVAIAAGMGWPGSLIQEARVSVLATALPGVLGAILIAASVATALGYLRLIVTGLWRPADELRVPVSRSARLGRWSATLLVVALAAFPVVLGLGGTRLASALAGWQPFAVP